MSSLPFYRLRLLQFLFVVLIPLLSGAGTADDSCSGKLLIVRRLSTLHTLHDGRFVSGCRLGQRTQLRVIPCSVAAKSGDGAAEHYVYVRVAGSVPETRGWIRYDDTVDVAALRNRVRQARQTGIVLSQESRLRLPALIRVQPGEIQKTWLELTELIAADAALPVEERLPDPLLARAMLHSLIGAHHEALQDYLRAGDLITESQFDPARWSHYLIELQEGLQSHDRQPAPAYLGKALDHWESGYYSFVSADYEASLREFGDAIGLNPERPLYWYFRALTLRNIGAHDEAERDARIGVYYEQKLGSSASHAWVTELPRRLERIQGPSRRWLQEFRRGNTDLWLNRLALSL